MRVENNQLRRKIASLQFWLAVVAGGVLMLFVTFGYLLYRLFYAY